MEDLKITILQNTLHWENKEKNLSLFTGKISSIKEETDLIILPEMFSTGFTMNAASMAEPMDGESVNWMYGIARKKNCVVTGSLIIGENGKYYNRLIWMKPDGIEFYDKRHLFGLAGENNTYSAGTKKITTTIKGWKILPLVCYDLRFPVWSRRTKKSDYDLLIYIANWPERRVHAWKQLLIARAIENQSYVAGVNRVGNDGNDIFHTGESAVVDFKGEIISVGNPSEEFIKTITLQYAPMVKNREQFSFFEDGDEFEIR